MRLQVFLSHNGVCSRRQAMDIVKSGRVSVNDKLITEPSYSVDMKKDIVRLDNERVAQKKYVYVMLNKPKGFVTTKAAQKDQKDIFFLLPKKYHHLSPVGRLDKDTEGLLLLTNDGDIAYKLTHPKFNLDKTYFVKCRGELKSPDKKRLEAGVYIDGRKTAPCKVFNDLCFKGNTSLRITIHEGRKRQIRRMFAKMGYKVSYLKREAQGPIKLGTLKAGSLRSLTDLEIKKLRELNN